MSPHRYCRHCQEFFDLLPENLYEGDIVHSDCGTDSIPARFANIESDEQIYSYENPL